MSKQKVDINYTEQRVRGDLRVKLIATAGLLVVFALLFLFNTLDTESIVTALVIFGLIFVIFLIGIITDLKALRHISKQKGVKDV